VPDLTYAHDVLWEQFPGGPKSGNRGFALCVERAYEGDEGVLYLRDLESDRPGTLLADTSARRLAEAILARLEKKNA
jgi:hypothetical protein